MKNQSTPICEIIETKMNEIDNELRILEWIFYQVCNNKIKNLGYGSKIRDIAQMVNLN
jgi:hypothetical protein